MAELLRDGARLQYSVQGASGRPTILLSHALGTSSALWDPQMPALLERFQVIRYDVRGHGASTVTTSPSTLPGMPGGPLEYTVEQLSRDALAILDACHVESAHICGLSLGGMVAIWLAQHARSRVRRIVLANTAARIGSVAFWQERIDLIKAQGLAPVAEGAPVRWFTEGFRRDHPELPARFQRMVLDCSADAYAACAAALRDGDLRPGLADLAAPALVIAGRYDPVTPPTDAEALVAGIPGAESLVLESAHFSNVEKADEFTNALIEFLGHG